MTEPASSEGHSAGTLALRRLAALRPLRGILVRLLKEAEEEVSAANAQRGTLWDWDMVYSFMYADSNKEFFGPAAVQVMEAGGEVIIPEGTRREMRRHLHRRATNARKRRIYLETQEPETRVRIAQIEESLSETWRPLSADFDALRELKAARKLLHLLEGRAVHIREVPEVASYVEPRKVLRTAAYSVALGALRHRKGEHRNKADALNIGQVEAAKGRGYQAKLMTGTADLLEAFPEAVVDPLTSVMSACLRKETPSAKERASRLNRWLMRVTKLIAEAEIVEEAFVSAKEALSKKRAQLLIAALHGLRDEPVIEECSEVLARVVQQGFYRLEMFNRRVEDADRILGRGPTASLRAIESSLEGVISEVASSLLEIGYTWKAEARECSPVRFSLLRSERGRQRPILQVEARDKVYSVRWRVEGTFMDFLSAAGRVLASCRSARTELPVTEALGRAGMIYYSSARRGADSIRLARPKVPVGEDIIRWRVIDGDEVIYYGVGEDGWPAGGSISSDFRSTDTPGIATVAVVSKDPSFRWVIELMRETSLEYIPVRLLRKELGDKLAGLGGGGRRVVQQEGQKTSAEA